MPTKNSLDLALGTPIRPRLSRTEQAQDVCRGPCSPTRPRAASAGINDQARPVHQLILVGIGPVLLLRVCMPRKVVSSKPPVSADLPGNEGIPFIPRVPKTATLKGRGVNK